MAASRAVFPLGECHPSILQRIIDRCDREDLFLLRLVARRFRDAVDTSIRRVRPSELPPDLSSRCPGLVSLDLRHCSRERVTAGLGPLLSQLPHLRELLELQLTATDLPAAAEWLPSLGALMRLRFYSVEDQAVFPAVAAHCHSLQQLELNKCRLDWVAVLSMFTHVAGTLTALDLSGPAQQTKVCGKLLPQGMSFFNTGRRLQTLDMCLTPFPQSANLSYLCHQLAAITSLLALDHSPVGSTGLERLNALAQLTRLHLQPSYASWSGVALLALAPVSDLALRGIHRSYRGADRSALRTVFELSAALAGFPRLTCLDISNCRKFRVGSALTRLPGLTRLVANNAELLDDAEALRGLSQLRHLSLEDSVAHESQLQQLSDLVSLTYLTLGFSTDFESAPTELSGSAAGWLAALSSLQFLCLQGDCVITADAVQQLARLRRLEKLSLAVHRLPLPPLGPLEHLPLRWLRLSEAHLLDELPPRLWVAASKGRRLASTWPRDSGCLPYAQWAPA